MLIRYPGSWHFVIVPRHCKGELAAFTTLHLGILHHIQPCFLQQVLLSSPLPAGGGIQLTDAGCGVGGVALS